MSPQQQSKPTGSIFDKLIFALFVMGLCFITFVIGSAMMHYRKPPSQFFSNSFNAIGAWISASQQSELPQIEVDNPQTADYAAINEKIITSPQTTWNAKKAYNGYTLLSTGFMDSAILVGMEGKIVHRWSMPFRTAWPSPKHTHPATKASTFFNTVKAYPNGDLLVQYSALGDTPYGYGIAKIDKNSNILWTYSENAHHDFYVDNHTGEIYALTHSMIKEPLKGLESLPFPMLTDFVVRLSQDGKEIDRIPVLEAFKDTPYEVLLYHERNGGLANWDHMHTNSVMTLEPGLADKFPMFKPGYILISVRSMNTIAVIDPATRKVVWAIDGFWKQQHAAQFLPSGNLMLFDNNGYVADDKIFSNIVEFNPKTLGVTWNYAGSADEPFRTSIIGRVQRLPNGNTLIAESMKARVFEITPSGEIVWSYVLQRAKRKDRTMNAITSSKRYSEQELPFLKGKTDEKN